ncbi:MAG: 4-alpha-glucanotransferase, partial [Pseudomonadota bacterium]
FEGGPQGFPDPAGWRAETLAAFGTHDTPTLAGWWAGEDLDLRERLGHLSPGQAAAERAARAQARAALLRRLAAAGLLPPGLSPDAPPPAADAPLRDAVHALLGASGSDLAALQLDDALGATQPQNVPGTVEEAPNWRRRHAVAPDALARDETLAAAVRAMAASRAAR